MKHLGADERAVHDKHVSDEYRILADETVPEWIEHKILAEAAAHINKEPRRGWIREWMRPIAFAATAGLCVAIFIDLNEDTQIELPETLENSRTIPAPAQPNAEQSDAAALSRAVRESGRQLQQLDSAVNGAQPTLPARHCSEEQSATADAWWDCILQLRSSGDRNAADAEYQLLAAAFPDFRPVE